MAATSGTTIGVPMNSMVSPALQRSTESFLIITSMLRGKLPAGTYKADKPRLMSMHANTFEAIASVQHGLECQELMGLL